MNDAVINAGTPVMLSRLLRGPIRDGRGTQIGSLADVIVRLGPEGYPAVTGLVARVGGRAVFVPAESVTELGDGSITLGTARLDLRPFERRPGEVLLKEAVLGHRLVDVEHARLVRAYDIAIRYDGQGWVATGVDVSAPLWRGRRDHPVRDWKSFDALIGHAPSAALRSRFRRLDGLRAAEIADVIESATQSERADLFEHLHGDPELEADVIEELDDDEQARVLRGRDTAEIAAVLSRMHADDVVDAILDLPQDRRTDVLDALPATQREDVLRLMRYQHRSAGGMMGVEYLAVAPGTSAGDAVEAVRDASMQDQALTTVHVVDAENRLIGAVGLIELLRADPQTPVREIAETEPVAVAPSDDVVAVVNTMADFNLLSVPVVADDGELVGIITVDDALEESIPDDWRERGRTRTP
ncbi:magnesium transporter MgtE N-terminal domain-containing protein [Leifsonia shinshuensis]|uniref:CBS domain-containing protein n=1 Tax=Leifsonia shinshuensis TaxID=150026 RepID=A0A853D1C6_9MICO|nr:CBS domain-containing protein [Leifsonia shinshuensis]NYJ25923.1 CBS domain-containing protein [Leifsonia shinshuensis]